MKTCPQCSIKYPDVLEFCPRDGSPLPAVISAREVPEDPILDTTIDGRYAIESRLGEGGMGVVYKARHVLIDKPVAIKILRKEAAQDTASVQRFIQEAKSASKINHSNIVDITDFGVLADGHAYFVMEFLQGQTLSQAIQEGPLDSARVCAIGAQVARGLYAAHIKGIVHRDLKPENIFLLEREGQRDFVKIVDFGIAKVGSGQKLTQVGMVLGTPEYMSPEQATGQETDARVDQYALGCIMYEMLTGVVPYLGERPAQTLTKHVFEALVPPRKRKPELKISAAVDAVVTRTLGKKPEQRFPSMRELEQALTKIETELKGGRVVVEDTGMAGPSSNSAQLAGAALGGQSQPNYAGNAPPPNYYPPAAPGYPIGATSPMVSSGHMAMLGPTDAAGAARPTREGQKVHGQRARQSFVFWGIALGLVLIIGLLIYILASSGKPSTPTAPPSKNPSPKTDHGPVVESPPKNPPPPIVEMPPVDLQVVSSPPGAEVYVNGNLVGKTPHRFSNKRGARVQIEVRKRGFEPRYEELEPDSDRTLDITLEKSGHGSKKKGTDSGKKAEPAAPTAAPPPSSSKPKSGGKSREGGSSKLPTGLRDPFVK